MNKLEETYDLIFNENIELINTELNNKGIILKHSNDFIIGIDKKQMKSDTEERIVLYEELGHYFTNSLYKVSNNTTLINKMEYRAKKWQREVLLPIDKLKRYIGRSIYEIADIFDVTADFVQKTIDFYEERGLLWQEI